MTITSKSTKPEIMAAYLALKAQPTTWQDAWALLVDTAKTVARETVSLAYDVYRLGAWCRKGFDEVVYPSLRSLKSLGKWLQRLGQLPRQLRY